MTLRFTVRLTPGLRNASFFSDWYALWSKYTLQGIGDVMEGVLPRLKNQTPTRSRRLRNSIRFIRTRTSIRLVGDFYYPLVNDGDVRGNHREIVIAAVRAALPGISKRAADRARREASR